MQHTRGAKTNDKIQGCSQQFDLVIPKKVKAQQVQNPKIKATKKPPVNTVRD